MKTCIRCGHTWKPIVENPKKCPKCFDFWNKPKKRITEERNFPIGIYPMKNGKFRAFFKSKYIGCFTTVELAQQAQEYKRKKHHDENT